MPVTTRSPRRPLVLVGITIVVGSVIGLVLAVGTILSLGYVPTSLIEQVREQHGFMLAADGLPDEVVRLVRTGELIPEALVAELSKDHAEALELTKKVLSSLMRAAADAVEISRSRSWIGVGVSLAAMILGAILTTLGLRQGRPRAS